MQLLPDGLAAHVAASATSGLVATVMSTPAGKGMSDVHSSESQGTVRACAAVSDT